jgi:hypothetical protein
MVPTHQMCGASRLHYHTGNNGHSPVQEPKILPKDSYGHGHWKASLPYLPCGMYDEYCDGNANDGMYPVYKSRGTTILGDIVAVECA